MGLEISKRHSYSFYPIWAKLYDNKAVIRVYKFMDILAICQKLQILWHFEILTWESMGKPKLWNISKTADRRAKRTKIWDSGYYSAHM